MKISKWLAAIGSCSLGISLFMFFGYIMPLMPEMLQNAIEKSVGILVIITFILVSIFSFIELNKKQDCLSFSTCKKNNVDQTKIKSLLKYVKWITPAIYGCYGLMYFVYLAFDYGSKQTHISAIGFGIITIALSLLAYVNLIIDKK